MKKILSYILFCTALTPLAASADCTQGKRSLQELLYEEKEDLITAHCSNEATGQIQYNYLMGLLRLGDMTSSSYTSSETAWNECKAENKLIRKVLKKDHGHEYSRNSDCSQSTIDLILRLEK
jgi:hypothetical protein